MPEVTPQWVDSKEALLEREDLCTCCPHTPILTLDQIEAWLQEERDKEADGLRNVQYIMALDDLLAQVQAWKAQVSSTN